MALLFLFFILQSSTVAISPLRKPRLPSLYAFASPPVGPRPGQPNILVQLDPATHKVELKQSVVWTENPLQMQMILAGLPPNSTRRGCTILEPIRVPGIQTRDCETLEDAGLYVAQQLFPTDLHYNFFDSTSGEYYVVLQYLDERKANEVYKWIFSQNSSGFSELTLQWTYGSGVCSIDTSTFDERSRKFYFSCSNFEDRQQYVGQLDVSSKARTQFVTAPAFTCLVVWYDSIFGIEMDPEGGFKSTLYSALTSNLTTFQKVVSFDGNPLDCVIIEGMLHVSVVHVREKFFWVVVDLNSGRIMNEVPQNPPCAGCKYDTLLFG